MMTWNMYNFQDSNSPIMEEMTLFHDLVMTLLMFISILIALALMFIMLNKFTNKVLLEGQTMEWLWTLIPGIILIFIAIPSISLLYMYEEINKFELSMKTIGHQWYWSYEIPNKFMSTNKSFDSFMTMENDLNTHEFRLLETDYPLNIPMNQSINLMVSSKDVLHSWTIPNLGIKADAIPGRINNLQLFTLKPGVFYGQCSEICGINHSFMPIMLEVTNHSDFIKNIMN